MIETERLILRPFRLEDLDEYTGIMGQDAVGQWLPKGRGYYREETEKFISNMINHWNNKGYGNWAVIEKSSGKIIGHCGLNFVPQVNEAEVMYAFGKESWGKGYATEAAKAAMDFGFNHVQLNNIVAFVKIGNEGSKRVIEKLGLKYVEDMDIFGMNCAYFTISKEEYEKCHQQR